MATTVYVTTSEAHCGKSLICMGLIEYALRRTKRVSIFRPIITSSSDADKDKNIDLILTHFNLDQKYEDSYALLGKEAQKLISKGDTDKLLDKVIQRFKSLESKSDFILCEGTDFTPESSAFEFDLNMHMAKNLNSPVLIIGRGDLNRSIQEVISPLQLSIDSFRKSDCKVAGAIVNRARQNDLVKIMDSLKNEIPGRDLFFSVIPENELLKSPTVGEIANHLNAEILYGGDQLSNQVLRYSIAAMQLPNYLTKITDNCLVITPGDRSEIILGALQAHISENYPKVAGIVLTTGLVPEPAIKKLLDGLPRIIPILSVDYSTYEEATLLSNIHAYITSDNEIKIQESLRVFDEFVNLKDLEEKSSKIEIRGMTPRMFQYTLTQKARQSQKQIVLAEGEDERILKAVELLTEQDIVKITLLGVKENIEKKITKLGLNIDRNKVNIVSPQDSTKYEEYVQTYHDLRKHKGINMDMAHDAMSDVSYFATMMVHKGDADGMVSGAVHTTQHTIRPALQFVKTKPGSSVVSSVFFMCLDDRVLVYGDCAINPNPNAQELAEIALSSAETAEAFGIEPKIAMLSYSSGESGKGADVDKVREATAIVKERMPLVKIEGPIQYDAAVDMGVGMKKMPGSDVAGQATVLIFPDLNTGNNTYKAVQRETGAIAIGPVLQGLNKPVNDLSRGCTITDIVNTAIITAIQSQ